MTTIISRSTAQHRVATQRNSSSWAASGAPSGIAMLMAAFALCLMITSASPVFAQNLQDQVRQLKRDVQDLQQQVFAGKPPASQSEAPATSAPTQIVGPATQIRVDALEEQIRRLTGKIEEIQFKLDQTANRVEVLSGDIDLRFSDLTARLDAIEGGSAVASPATNGTGANAIASQNAGSTQTLGAIVVPNAGSASSPLPDDPDESYKRAYALVIGGQYDRAETELTRFLEVFPDSPKASNAQYWLAETHYARKQYEDAARAFAAGIQSDPEGPKAPDNLLKLGLSLAALDQKDKACIALGEINVRHPNAAPRILSTASEEQRRLGC